MYIHVMLISYLGLSKCNTSSTLSIITDLNALSVTVELNYTNGQEWWMIVQYILFALVSNLLVIKLFTTAIMLIMCDIKSIDEFREMLIKLW